MVRKTLENREYKLKLSKESKGYKSYSLKLTVFSDDDRKAIYEALGLDKDVKFIL
jgi:putative lipoic acid-binding regulatory protein